jgi:hypothetical protein
MKIAMLGCFGFLFGAFVGGLLGIGAGFLWTNLFQTSCFEGYCGMLVFFTFMPIGAILGGLAGAVTLGYFGAQESTEAPTNAPADLPRDVG